ncbi:MAG TPA: BlaI/MecI/CopY family transcriptional regulator [Steroidobacteraceae bacterium]|nr:BlaI/MecI/CopY family transcriptional regulator [Steroidobacteraceae bacterium]
MIMKASAELGELERQVLQIVWEQGDVTADQVRQAIDRPLKESTVRTVLTRLERKGYVMHEVQQRTFLYRAAKARGQVAARAVKRIADWFCNGSLDEVLVGMVQARLLSQRDLQRITEKVVRERSKSGSK